MMKSGNLPFFGEDVVDLHLVVTQQFACVGVKNLWRHLSHVIGCKTSNGGVNPNVNANL